MDAMTAQGGLRVSPPSPSAPSCASTTAPSVRSSTAAADDGREP